MVSLSESMAPILFTKVPRVFAGAVSGSFSCSYGTDLEDSVLLFPVFNI